MTVLLAAAVVSLLAVAPAGATRITGPTQPIPRFDTRGSVPSSPYEVRAVDGRRFYCIDFWYRNGFLALCVPRAA